MRQDYLPDPARASQTMTETHEVLASHVSHTSAETQGTRASQTQHETQPQLADAGGEARAYMETRPELPPSQPSQIERQEAVKGEETLPEPKIPEQEAGEVEEEIVEFLGKSKGVVGELSEIIVDSDGEILSGRHRVKAGFERKRIVDTEAIAKNLGLPRRFVKEMYKIHFNTQRRPKPEETKRRLLVMAEELVSAGVPREHLVAKLAETTPFSDRYIRELLPDEFKAIEFRHKEELVPPPQRTYVPLHFVKCANCDVSVSEPMEWEGRSVCGVCYGKLSRGEIKLEKPAEARKPRRPEPVEGVCIHFVKLNKKEGVVECAKKGRVSSDICDTCTEAEEYHGVQIPAKPKETWETRKAVMHPQISEMDQAVLIELQKRGIRCEFQRAFWLQKTTPDIFLTEHNTAIYLDGGEAHKNKEERDEALREQLEKIHDVRVLSLSYEHYSESEKERIVQAILGALGGVEQP